MGIGECYIFANENGLVLQVEEEYDDFVPAGAIISQSIKPEEKVKKGTEITLVVSKGKMIHSPDFCWIFQRKGYCCMQESWEYP